MRGRESGEGGSEGDWEGDRGGARKGGRRQVQCTVVDPGSSWLVSYKSNALKKKLTSQTDG